MPDWRSYVRQRLSLPDCAPEREAQIIEELAEQLDEAYEEALQGGLGEHEALTETQRHVSDWEALKTTLLQGGVSVSQVFRAATWQPRLYALRTRAEDLGGRASLGRPRA